MMKTSIQRLRLLWITALCSMLCSSCSQENLAYDPDRGPITFVITIPVSSDPYTRAIREGGVSDNRVDQITMVLFDDATEKYIDFVTPSTIETVAGMLHTKKFTVELPSGKYKALVLANANSMLTGDFSLDETNRAYLRTKTLSDFTDGLSNTHSGKWQTDTTAVGVNGFQPFPMAAYYTIPANRSAMEAIQLTRMQAKINLMIDATVSSQFTIQEVRLCNDNRSGMLLPGNTHNPSIFNSADLHLPASPNMSTGLANAHLYKTVDGEIDAVNNCCVDEMFLYETDAVSDADWKGGVCLIVKGKVMAAGGVERWFRINLRGTDAGEGNRVKHVHIVRNIRYTVTIKSINGYGFSTPQEAYDAYPEGMETDIEAWSEGGMNDITYNGKYQLAVNKPFLFIPYVNDHWEAQTLNIYTDYPGGWTIEPLDGWITSPTASTTGIGGVTTSITVSCSDNDSGIERIGSFVIRAGDLYKEIDVYQQVRFTSSIIEGYIGRIIIYYTDNTDEMATITSNGILHLINGDGKTIKKIELLDKGDKEHIIGRTTEFPLHLKIDTHGDILFRAAVNGYTPIGSYAELHKINDNSSVRAGSYRQDEDIDLMGDLPDIGFWSPVGNNSTQFTGVYEGNNKSISRLYTDHASNHNYVGLFGAVGGGTVQNLHIKISHVIGGNYVGSITGIVFNNGHITNCSSSGGSVSGSQYVGGLVGSVEGGSVSYCQNNSVVTNSYRYIGGITGYVSNGLIEACEHKGTIYGTERVGGIVGYLNTNGIVNACKSSGIVSATGTMTGGIAGEVLNGSVVRNSYVVANVTGTTDVGGIVGCVTRGTTTGLVEYCYASCEVRGTNAVGGIVGVVNSGAMVRNSVALNSIVRASIANVGRVAYMSGGNIINCLAWDGVSNGGGVPFTGGVQIAHDHMDGKNITSSQAMMLTTYTNFTDSGLPTPLGWNFTTTWKIVEGVGYPMLQWE